MFQIPRLGADARDEGAADFVDPSPPQTGRLSRRNVLALVLTIVGVLLVLLFSSRRGAPRRGAVDVRPEPGYVGRAPIEIGVPDEGPQTPPEPSPWSPPTPPEGAAASQPEPDTRQQHYEQALRAPAVRPVSGAAPPAGRPGSAPETTGAGVPGREPQPTGGQAAGRAGETVRLRASGDYAIAEATVIEAALVTGINSARPGPVVARVIRPVYDSANMQHELIPAGTRLVGELAQALAGQDRRVVLAWTRMIFPDGRAMSLPGFPAIETRGEGGLQDRVNLHMASLFGRAALIALLGGATTYAASAGDGGSAIGPATFVGASLGLELSRVATTMLRQGLRRSPTVTIRPGYRFLVYVAHDLVFDEPYVERPSPPRFAVPAF